MGGGDFSLKRADEIEAFPVQQFDLGSFALP